MTDYLFRLLIALDQLINVAICNGWPDETMSSTAYRMERKGCLAGCVLRPFIDWIFSPWHADHCKEAYDSELAREHLAELFRRARQ